MHPPAPMVDDDPIPFDDGAPRVHGPRRPSEWDLRSAGYEIVTILSAEYEEPYCGSADDLSDWAPALPEGLQSADGWYLAEKRYEAIVIETGFGPDGEVEFEKVEFHPLAVWARRPVE